MAKKKKDKKSTKFSSLPRDAQEAFFAKLKGKKARKGKPLLNKSTVKTLKQAGIIGAATAGGAFLGTKIGKFQNKAVRLARKGFQTTTPIRRNPSRAILKEGAKGAAIGALYGVIFGQVATNEGTSSTQKKKLLDAAVKEAKTGKPRAKNIRKKAREIEKGGKGRFTKKEVKRAIRMSREMAAIENSIKKSKEKS